MNLRLFIEEALEEDIGREDVTSSSIIPIERTGSARIFAKQKLIVCGHTPASMVFSSMGCIYEQRIPEGSWASPGEDIAIIQGPYRNLLSAERLSLNFLMKLCGIATHTKNTIEGINTKIRIVDTRKTTPLFRSLERGAVRIGGGHNHRFALYDGILIKENHIMVAGSISEAIHRAKKYAHHLLKVEIEVESISQLEEAIDAGADVVMLDNMTNAQLLEAIEINKNKSNGRVLLEASGNMDRERILSIQDFGIDIISMGGLIHQATWADISMRIIL
jgi:nicotinate-nucleotide pyrophosphorylase (carboxylating)